MSDQTARGCRLDAARPLTEAVAWSRHANEYLVMLEAFTKGMLTTAGPLSSVSERGLFGQRAAPSDLATPEFEEASIRQCDPKHLPPTPEGGRGGGANSFQMTPGRARALCVSVASLVWIAV